MNEKFSVCQIKREGEGFRKYIYSLFLLSNKICGMQNKIKIIVDDKIPFIRNIFEPCAEVLYLPPVQITQDMVADADALVIRTRTKCDERLLSGSSVRFIGTATIGTDHIDIPYCEGQGITWKNAPGCNAESVAQYVSSVLARFSIRDGFKLHDKTIGIVGVGHVGSRVEQVCRILGMKVLLNDPLREEAEGSGLFVSLQEIERECDIISFHTPLTYTGNFPSFHLADDVFFSRLRKRPIIINAARGEVVDTCALLNAFDEKLINDAVIDCWEGEPNIDLRLLDRVYVATPHIAGYSADGKANATRTMIDELARFFGFSLSSQIKVPVPDDTVIDLAGVLDFRIENALLSTYDPMSDSCKLKITPCDFEKLRGNYGLRRESRAYTIRGFKDGEKGVLRELGFCLENNW